MPMINFNVAFRDIDGKVITEVEHDKNQFVVDANGNKLPQPVLDENGNPKQKTIFVRELISTLLLGNYQGDESLPFDARVKRGALARKVFNNDAANYTIDELQLIQDLAAKSRSTLVLLAIDDLINSKEG